MARHPMRSDGKALLVRLSIAIADDEQQMIRDAAASAGMSVSGYLRYAALGTAAAEPATRDRVFSAAGAAIPAPR
jgi:uncharacterized protein (DUF1778 family)